MTAGPLDGVRVFDMTLWMVGPWASTQLGALGADVIHIEQPGVDPRTLGAGVPPAIDGTSIGYITWNMNKRGLFLDLKSQADRETAYRLLQTCDVFLVNMRPGAADRLGMGYEQVRAANPKVVYTAITGWGETGPMRDSPGADVQCQYFTGFWSTNGAPGGRPEVYRHFTQMDASTGNVAAQAVLMGLLARHRTGQGQRIHVGMLRAGMALQSAPHRPNTSPPATCTSRSVPPASPLPPTRPSAARTVSGSASQPPANRSGNASSARSNAPRPPACPRCATTPALPPNRDRVAHRDELAAILDRALLQRPRDYWMMRLTAARVPCGYALSWDVLRNHAQVTENGYIRDVLTSGWGSVQTGGPPWTLEGTPARWTGTPLPGEHTGDILDSLPARIPSLQAAGD